MTDCMFCQIVQGRAPCHQVYEDDEVLAFLDIFPVSPGHVLVIPKEHAVDIFDLEEASALAVARVARKVAYAVEETLRPDGLMVSQLNREAAGQTVFHYHMHLIPRAAGDSMAMHARVPGDPDEMAGIASRLVVALGH